MISRSGYSSSQRKGSNHYERRQRAIALACQTRCAYCGGPPSSSDPFEAAHVIARSNGGSEHHTNLRAAHRSCNRRAGNLNMRVDHDR